MESAKADWKEPAFEQDVSALFLSTLVDTSFAPGFSRGASLFTMPKPVTGNPALRHQLKQVADGESA